MPRFKLAAPPPSAPLEPAEGRAEASAAPPERNARAVGPASLPALVRRQPDQPDFARLRQLQLELAARVETEDRLGEVKVIAATDLSAGPWVTTVWAAVVVFRWPGLELLETVAVFCREPFPYRTGLLGFREVPPLVEAFRRLTVRPDLVLADGQGLAHPRRFGLACHLGLSLDLPAIGCAKSRLLGEPARPLPERAGSAVPLLDGDEPVGYLYRSRTGSKPLWLSPGHRISATTALAWVRRVTGPWRIPIPLREAHVQANRARKGELQAVEIAVPAEPTWPSASGGAVRRW